MMENATIFHQRYGGSKVPHTFEPDVRQKCNFFNKDKIRECVNAQNSFIIYFSFQMHIEKIQRSTAENNYIHVISFLSPTEDAG